MPASVEKAQSDLCNYLVPMERCVRAALRAYVEKYASVRHSHSKRSDASVVHDLIVESLKGVFPTQGDKGSEKIAVCRDGNLNLIVVDGGAYRIRIKKFGSRFQTRNILTQTTLNFLFQNVQSCLPGFAAPTNLVLGYQPPDDVSLLSSTVWLTCPIGSGVEWILELRDAADTQQSATPDIVPFEEKKSSAPTKKRVSVKELAKKKARKKKDGSGNNEGSD